jgi:hypothetical protein
MAYSIAVVSYMNLEHKPVRNIPHFVEYESGLSVENSQYTWMDDVSKYSGSLKWCTLHALCICAYIQPRFIAHPNNRCSYVHLRIYLMG